VAVLSTVCFKKAERDLDANVVRGPHGIERVYGWQNSIKDSIATEK